MDPREWGCTSSTGPGAAVGLEGASGPECFLLTWELNLCKVMPLSPACSAAEP